MRGLRGAALLPLLLAGLLSGCAEPPDGAVAVVAVDPAAGEAEEREAVDWTATIASQYCATAGGVQACGTGPRIGSAAADPAPP